jgi:ABC-type multidrug transport system permease subunit
VLFLDEPTSGLDARAAMIVMDSMKRIADTGRTVLATIHQPNIDIFSKFDGLLLLGKDGNRGGFTTYFNESIWEPDPFVVASDRFLLENYFNEISLKKLPNNFNTATWMLNVIEEDRSQNWCYYYENHELHDSNEELAASIMSTQLGVGVPDTYVAPAKVQYSEVLYRTIIQYWRSPSFSFSRLFVIFFVSGLVALIFEQQDYKNAAAVQSRCSVIAFMVMLGGIYNLYTMIPFFTSQRAVFYRERSAGMYNNAAYVFSTWVEIPYLALETLLGVNTMYWLIGFRDDTMFPWVYYNLCYFLYLALQTFMGMVLSALMPNVMASQLIAALFINICSLFAGTSVPPSKIPDYYKFLYWFSPQKWAQEGVLTTQFHGDDTIMCNPQGLVCGEACAAYPYGALTCTSDGTAKGTVTGQAVEVGKYVLDEFLDGYKYETRFYDLMVLAVWAFFARMILLVLINKVSHLRR